MKRKRVGFFKWGRKRVPKMKGRRKVGIIKIFSSKWTDKVVWVKRAGRVRRER